MTNSEGTRIEQMVFNDDAIGGWFDPKDRHHNWPVVYLINDRESMYVGETTRVKVRLRQHRKSLDKQPLELVRILINEQFNKSACLDLESRLIAWLHADNVFKPLNRNDGQQNSNYFERHTRYQKIFDEVFEQLREADIFKRTVAEIENLNLFKLSPFKALNDEQLISVEGILEGLFEDLKQNHDSTSVIQGGPGTGKTIVGIYLTKLLCDIQQTTEDPDPEDDGRFSDFFHSGFREALAGLRIGFVVPQQSLRTTIESVFKKTTGLGNVEVLSPYTVANSDEDWDILLIDEAHRLTHRGAGPTRGQFNERQLKLFGQDAEGKTAIDWMEAKSRHRIFLVDGAQSVRPADVPSEATRELVASARMNKRLYPLDSQMRLAAGEEYLEFAKRLLTGKPIDSRHTETYDLRLYDDFSQMRKDIRNRERQVGLSRLVAGYAWKWVSKGDSTDEAPYDITLDGEQIRWNRSAVDWIASSGSEEEMGSVHTVQGYDLNYAGVVIGPDIIWDEDEKRIRAVKSQHFDREVRTVKDEQQLLEYIQNSYYVLLTRGMKGTYIYVCDPALRERVKTACGY